MRHALAAETRRGLPAEPLCRDARRPAWGPPSQRFVLLFLCTRQEVTRSRQYEAPVPPSADVFVSYSREDATRVSDLVGKLRAAGVSLWIDQGGIDAASQWSEQIVNALESAKAMLLMVSGSAVHSHNVAKEVVLVSERKGHILPVHLQPTVIPPALKYQLAGIQHVEYFKESDEALKAILRALERLGVKIAPPAVRAPPLAPRQPEGAAPAAAASLERGALA